MNRRNASNACRLEKAWRRAYTWSENILETLEKEFLSIFFIGYSLYLYFKCYPLSQFSPTPRNSLSHPPCPAYVSVFLHGQGILNRRHLCSFEPMTVGSNDEWTWRVCGFVSVCLLPWVLARFVEKHPQRTVWSCDRNWQQDVSVL